LLACKVTRIAGMPSEEMGELASLGVRFAEVFITLPKWRALSPNNDLSKALECRTPS
jgi:hypothetical protein